MPNERQHRRTEAPAASVLLNGGKFNLAPWIISFFPVHKHYVEPCGGAASVLLQKPRSKLETFNDLDSNVVNFFAMLRDRPDELIRKIRLTPWAREEYELHRVPVDDPIEKARRFWMGCNMAISCMAFTSSGMRLVKDPDKFPNLPPSLVGIKVDHLEATAARLKGVQIEHKPYEEIIAMYDHPKALFYFDPPYVQSERANPNTYHFEWDEQKHIEAARLLNDCKSYIVVSGYQCQLYSELYEAHGWARFDKKAMTNSGGSRIESVWLSPRTLEALNKPQQSQML